MDDIRFEILQLNDKYADRRFRGLAELDQATMPIRDEQFDHVYQGTCQPDTSLEAIYTRFNIDRPEDFHGWSLSVGDVVLMHRDDGDHAYFVDSFGFSEIQGFSEPLTHENTVSMESQQQAEPETMLMTVRCATRDEQEFAYTPGGIDLDSSGCIGHLRIDMGREGNSFYPDWSNESHAELPDGFSAYLDTMVSELRTNPAFDGILSDRSSLSSFCYRHPESRIPDEDNKYAFRADAGEYAMILRLTPNRGEYNAYIYCYQRDRLDRWLSIWRYEQSRGYLPVYRHTASYARSVEELETWRMSHRENVACRKAIDDTIREHFDGYHLDEKAVSSVMERFGSERVSFVLANTIMMKEHDGRFSRQNRAWAQAEQIPIDRTELGVVRNDEYVAQSHPAVLDGFISMARREMKTPAVDMTATITLRGSERQRQAQREDRNNAQTTQDGQSDRSSVRSSLREKQAQAKTPTAEKKQLARAPKRESL